MAQDEFFMAHAISLARRGQGRTSPNPSVGAVLVRPDLLSHRIVGRGVTAPGGVPHAETGALAEAGAHARGATLYVSLEPCSHRGRTPPCVDAVIAAGVSRVVAALEDPNPLVRGQGAARLRAAGVEVSVGVLADAARDATLGHILRMTEARPAVTLKLAVGSDGRTPAGDGGPRFVTGGIARAHAHLLRARHDAILIGRGTAETDDPELTCRLPGMEDRSPLRVVLDSRLKMSPAARMLRDGGPPVIVCCAHDAPMRAEDVLAAAGAEILRVDASESGLSLADVLRRLAERGIATALVEGGPQVAGSLLATGLVDRVALYRGAEAAGATGLQPFGADGLDRLDAQAQLTPAGRRQLGPDSVTFWKRSF
jgi:diaminohydroxyphosphoribosylaminopyrimidine deaminase/5-amino-6-(5-phosphoribosylamino)uracil reductase